MDGRRVCYALRVRIQGLKYICHLIPAFNCIGFPRDLTNILRPVLARTDETRLCGPNSNLS